MESLSWTIQIVPMSPKGPQKVLRENTYKSRPEHPAKLVLKDKGNKKKVNTVGASRVCSAGTRKTLVPRWRDGGGSSGVA